MPAPKFIAYIAIIVVVLYVGLVLININAPGSNDDACASVVNTPPLFRWPMQFLGVCWL